MAPGVVGAIIAAAVALVGLVVTTSVAQWRDRRQRRSDMFAKAYAATVAYSEFPYVVRRRRSDDPAGERSRISTELRKIQEDIAFYEAWMHTESTKVAQAYADLVKDTRVIAGGQIHEAWKLPAIETDEQMNMPDIGLGALSGPRKKFLAQARKSLRLTSTLIEDANT